METEEIIQLVNDTKQERMEELDEFLTRLYGHDEYVVWSSVITEDEDEVREFAKCIGCTINDDDTVGEIVVTINELLEQYELSDKWEVCNEQPFRPFGGRKMKKPVLVTLKMKKPRS